MEVIRLPLEEEWQWVAQAGKEARKYPWPGGWDTRRANSAKSGIGRTLAVGLYPQGASPNRIMDMAGNIWEWCLNKYDDPDDAASDASDASGDRRVLRGGAWIHSPGHARAAVRDGDHPDFRFYHWGFRVVCVSPIIR